MMRQSKSIGSILLDVELVTPDDIENGLELQKQTGKRLGEVLVSLGVVSDDDIRWALAEQLNLPYVNIRKDQIDPDVAKQLPEQLARRYHVIPILKIDKELTVVVDDPLNTTIIRDIEKITKCDVKISLGRISDILLAIDEIYGTSDEQSASEKQAPPRFISTWFQDEDVQKILNDPSGHVLMAYILGAALRQGVSRIHFQQGIEQCHVSYRLHGELQEQMQLSQEWYSILLFRLKINADFDIVETARPQYRECMYTEHLPFSVHPEQETHIALAASILPTNTGESAILKIMNKPVSGIWLTKTEAHPNALQERELEPIREFQQSLSYLNSGAVLLAGRPSLEKITTLYGLLQEFDPLRKQIVVLESHAEYQAEHYYQIRYAGGNSPNDSLIRSTILPDASLLPKTFHLTGKMSGTAARSSFRHSSPIHSDSAFQESLPSQAALSGWLSLLREHEPDILFVDHISGDRTLAQSFDFAGKGLLFASLDFPTVFDLLAYLLDAGVHRSLIVSRIRILMAQYSVRLLCNECKQPDESSIGKQFVQQLDGPDNADRMTLYAPQGCPACHASGYRTQIVLFELLPMQAWLKQMLLEGANPVEMQHAASEHGFQSLQGKCADLARSGETSAEEIYSLLV